MLDPLIHGILRIVGKHPVRIVPGTFLLALLLHLDGSGAVVFLIAIPALLPLYDEVGILTDTKVPNHTFVQLFGFNASSVIALCRPPTRGAHGYEGEAAWRY